MIVGIIDLVSFLFVISMTLAVSISSGLSRAQSAWRSSSRDRRHRYTGLIMMLQNMDDPNAVFPALAVAPSHFIFVNHWLCCAKSWFHVRASLDGCCVEITVPECTCLCDPFYALVVNCAGFLIPKLCPSPHCLSLSV